MSKRSIWVEASRLRANTKIALWLRHYQRIGRDTARITVETHLAELARSRELALAHGQIAAGVHAEHCRGKVVGLYEKSVGFADTVSDIELLPAIETMLGGDTAQAISAALKGDQ
jgi:hypothetical protein